MNRHKAQAIIACILAGMTWSRSAGAAPIQADPQADSRHKPQVLQTASGIPLVQIAAPRNGLSHNKYQDFSVTEKGAILNNSFTLTKTRLAGLVQGNSNMAGGAARVILNEVTGNNLSNLNGFLEVAGNKADVILANPNGIAVNGGGLLNTSRALLTTGRPVFGADGKLEQFRVERGQVTIDGNGLDGKEADSVAILSRAARINAGIWAKKLQITTGQNQIDAGTLQPTVLDTQSENKPEVALDVAAVGGMYAGSIYLVGTEKGLGVNLSGAVQADGKITVDVDGSVHVQKELTGGDVQLQAENIRNTGWITSGKNLELKAQKIEDAGGTLTAGENAGIQAGKADLQESHTYAGNRLELAADSLSIDKAALHGETGVKIQAKTMPLTGNITSKGNIRVQVEQDLTNAESAAGYGNVQAAGDVVLAARGNGENRKKIESGGTLTFQSGDKLVNSGEISGRQIQANAREIRNTGVISADEQVELEGGTLTNESGGRIYGDSIAIRASQVVNRREEAKEQELAEAVEELRKRESDLEKQVRKDVAAFRSDAEVQAYEDGIQAAGKAYDQQKNQVDALKQKLEKTGTGTIAAREQFSITAESIQNSADSLLYSGGTLDLQAAGEAADVKIHDLTFIRTKSQTSHKEVTESRPGVITSGGTLTITGAVKNVDSQLVAGDTLHIQGTLENQAQKEQERTVTFGTT